MCNQAEWILSYFAMSVVVSASKVCHMECFSLSGTVYSCAECSNLHKNPFMHSLKGRSQVRLKWNGTFYVGKGTAHLSPGRFCLQQLSQSQHALSHAAIYCFEGDADTFLRHIDRLLLLGTGLESPVKCEDSSSSKATYSGSKQPPAPTEGIHADTAAYQVRAEVWSSERSDPCLVITFSLYSSLDD